jgi:hypothetical protein
MAKPLNRNDKSAAEYLDTLFKQYSKLNVLRVDLAYKKEIANNLTLEEAKNDMRHLLNNRRSKPSIFSNCVGHIFKIETTEEKGPHIHTAFIFDGSKVEKDVYLASKLGKYWVDKITDKRGIFHNCNAEKAKYEKCGIGKISHNDEQMRSNLVNEVIPYLTKGEQSIKSLKTGREKSFSRGIPVARKSNAGRKRK